MHFICSHTHTHTHTQNVSLLGGNSLTCAFLDDASCLRCVPTVRSIFQGQDVIIQKIPLRRTGSPSPPSSLAERTKLLFH